MSQHTIPILHGPHLKAERQPKGQKRKPATWQLPFRCSGAIVDAVEKMARDNKVAQADIIRSAVAEYIKKYAYVDAQVSVNDQPAVAAISQPRQVAPYRGNGKSDHAGLMQVNDRQAARQASGQAGERLVDKSTAR